MGSPKGMLEPWARAVRMAMRSIAPATSPELAALDSTRWRELWRVEKQRDVDVRGALAGDVETFFGTERAEARPARAEQGVCRTSHAQHGAMLVLMLGLGRRLQQELGFAARNPSEIDR